MSLYYPQFEPTPINFLINNGGVGDTICRMIPITYIIKAHPHVLPIIWVADYFESLAKNVFADEPKVKVMKFSDNHLYDKTIAARAAEVAWFNNLKMDLTTHAFCLLANEIPGIEHRNYPKLNMNPIAIKKFNLPKKYVVCTVAYTAEIRKFLPEYVNEINKYIKSKGLNIVFLGQEKTSIGLANLDINGKIEETIDFGVGLNLINKTSLLEAAKIMNKSEFVFGIDNGIIHVAAMTDAKILGGFTSVAPKHRLPVRNNIHGYNYWIVEPPDSEPEKYFQSRIDFEFDHDFRFSYFKNDSLVRSLKPELWIEKIDEILDFCTECGSKKSLYHCYGCAKNLD